MASSLGMDAANACAAARAGITRVSEAKCMNFRGSSYFGKETVNGFPQFTCHASAVAPGYTHIARLTLLGSAALQDLLLATALTPKQMASCGLYLNFTDQFLEQAHAARMETGAVPESFDYPAPEWANEVHQAVNLLLTRSGIDIHPGLRYFYFGGHAGFARAVRDACSRLRAGHVDRCIVGAIDCCIEPR